MILLYGSGTQTATVGSPFTEHSLSSVTASGYFALVVDRSAMTGADVLELRTYEIVLASGTKRLVQAATFYGAASNYDYIVESEPLMNELGDANSLQYTLCQPFGTGRNYPWKVLREQAMGLADTLNLSSPDDNTVMKAMARTYFASGYATVSDFLTTAMTESYNTDGAAPTVAQALFGIYQLLTESSVSGTTLTVKKLDGSTTAMTLTLNSSTAPTSVTRAS